MADQGPLVPGELKAMRSRVGPVVQKAQAVSGERLPEFLSMESV